MGGVIDFVKTLDQMQEKTVNRENHWVYQTPAEILLTHGEYYDPDQLPSEEYEDLYEEILENPEFARVKQCFRNAMMVALTYPAVAYVEGYAAGIIPVHHAWNALPDGTVIDCTWHAGGTEKREYFGVEVPDPLVQEWFNDWPPGLLWWENVMEYVEHGIPGIDY